MRRLNSEAFEGVLAPAFGGPMDRALVEYFKCPADIGTFPPLDCPSASEGYFVFHGTVCYGSCSGAEPEQKLGACLADMSDRVTAERCRVHLPFELSEVVRNLQQERYCQEPAYLERITASGPSRRMYYFIRP